MKISLLVLLGLLVGALINWLADTLPAKSDLGAPSCSTCTAPRPPNAWLALSALVTRSWRCPYCGTPIGWRHVGVEGLAVALAVALEWGGWGPAGYGPALLISSIFLLITVIDIEHRLILHVVSLPAIVIVALMGILDPSRGAEKTLLGGAAGLGITLGLFLLGVVFAEWVARRRRQPLQEVAFGFGDVTLGALIGLAVGWPGVVLALVLGVLAAGLFSLAFLLWLFARGRYQPYLPIPYGPFMILGAMLVYLGGRDLFTALAG